MKKDNRKQRPYFVKDDEGKWLLLKSPTPVEDDGETEIKVASSVFAEAACIAEYLGVFVEKWVQTVRDMNPNCNVRLLKVDASIKGSFTVTKDKHGILFVDKGESSTERIEYQANPTVIIEPID